MMSGSRKEFDVKQILRIRWRWFGHPASPPPHSPAQGDFFSGRNAGASADSTSSGATSGGGGNISCGTGDVGSCINSSDNRKFLGTSDHPVSLSAAASVCLRSFSEGDCRSSPPPPWACPQPEVPGVEPVDQGCATTRQHQPEGAAAEAVAESEEENINVDSESSSYRSSNSSQTLSSSQTAEPCVPEELFQSLSHAEHTFHKMETYLRHKQLCDVVLLAGDRRIPAHRLVLSSVSDYFGAMFTSNVREAKQEEVKMEGVDPDALWALVQYAYTGRLELREDTVESLLAASCLLQLSAVVQACCSFLVKQLHPSNCLGIRSFADAQGCQDLLKVAHNYAMYLADLEGDPLLLHNADCQRLLMEAMKFHLLPERRLLLQSPRTRPRKATVGALFAVGGMDATKGATTIEQYCTRRDSWRQVAVMSGRRLQFGVAVLEERLYVVGGRDGLKTLNTVECYNPRSKSWSAMPPMATNRHGVGVAVLEGPMYAVGGHDGWSYLSSVERWDPQTRQWSFVASMATPRSTVGVAVLGSKLYAVGGRDGSACLSSVECFDPHTNKWSGCSPMAKRRGGVGVATWNGFLYAIGGHDAAASSLASRLSDCVERYDPKTNMWTGVASMTVSRDAVGVCLLGDRLYAVGGYDGQSYLDVVEAYDPQTNEWTQVAPLCLGRAGTCVVAVKL
ncbi:kelch-like protein 5 isoform X2 [Brienomyrus brachyistius]|uniref:kelch-like protein 5 isoform X2 n=1 Tax=Brienomyrus brachyistius TaxID=42636 RepID=UPI0020B40BDA|nr:kelch-like protein 5 isoform X2 [Brienomyrus brachyistius]